MIRKAQEAESLLLPFLVSVDKGCLQALQLIGGFLSTFQNLQVATKSSEEGYIPWGSDNDR